MHSSAVGLSTQWCKLILPEKQEDKMSKWPRERFDNWVSESNFVTEEWVNKKKNKTEEKQNRHEARDMNSLFILTFSLFVFPPQKLVKESSHHSVMAALPAPPTLRAVSLLCSSDLSLWLLFVFYYSHLSLLPVHYLPQYKLSSPRAMIIPVFVVQNLSFVWAHVKDWTYRRYGSTVIV